MVKDGPFGRLALGMFRTKRIAPRRGFELYYSVTTPDPADTDPGARVPSRQLSRFWPSQLIRVVLDWRSGMEIVPAPDLEGELEKLKPEELAPADAASLGEAFGSMGPRALEIGRKLGVAMLDQERRKIATAIADERDERLEKLARSLIHQCVSPEEREAVLLTEHASYDALIDALGTCRLQLDSVLAFVILP